MSFSFRSEAALVFSQAYISSLSAFGKAGCSKTMFWNSVARWTSQAPLFGNSWNISAGSVEAPCCTAPASPYSLRAIFEMARIASKSIETFATVPSGRTTPPWEVPVLMEIFETPGIPAGRAAR